MSPSLISWMYPNLIISALLRKKSNTQALKEITSFLFLTHLPPHTSTSLLDLLSIKTLRLKTFHLPKITLLWQPEQCVPEQHIVITTKTLSMTPKINLST